jgi:threonine/homoserine/homoserine lactone efflux protein
MPAMLLDALLKGIAAGIIVSLPVGPVGVLCLRRTLFEGVAYGLISGLGAALADSLYGVVAGFGLTIVRDSLLLERDWLGAAGGVFLFAAGCKALVTIGTYRTERLAGERMAYAFGSTFALTLANPITILAFAAIFSQIGIGAASGYAGIAVLVAGVFLGSLLCWVGLCFAVKALRRFGLTWLSRVSGAVLMVSGVALLAVSLLRLTAILS